ncbi:dTDP-4-dehydrorhamnose 3,5-epimerase [Lusitaniella coriacea LEGE 07157]|uniref:dTDP-4-dehydrorhamnose 3,5-epimerase n=1 Tax=Lusitaniella coriacea LEGE 07157 TaxID=945747 RepID=A0A8J7E1T9_9CYAN|nr:dTDP-4-dehydrorhamnose 3,5-epimerase [Lusitaniella coriacea]MBE9119086.1 dTDP-4-dehydrorhamnose 3,5-epimerase [Lusitaniella coriacea LEGE 07157]
MLFTPTRIEGAYILDVELLQDRRGHFARTFCQKEFEQYGLNSQVVQCSISSNNKKGTLRGMHYQLAPSKETKLVRCTRGAIYDVTIDLRPDSPTYLSHVAVELTAENNRTLYIPAQCAHGFQTLADNAEVFYQMGDFYQPEYSTGVRYDDPTFGIEWPLPISEIAQKDRTWLPYSAFI